MRQSISIHKPHPPTRAAIEPTAFTSTRCGIAVLWLAVLALLALTGCDEEEKPRPLYPAVREKPALNLPVDARNKNWIRNGSGSCYNAAMCDVLIWQGYDAAAADWRRRFGGASSMRDIVSRLNHYGFDYAYTSSGSAEFLEWCSRTRRGAAIEFYPNHAITLVHFDERWAAVRDNNNTKDTTWIPREKFLHLWRNYYGGRAITAVHTPAAPRPTPFHL
jgi:hypothetical protein